MDGHYMPGDVVLGKWTLTRLIGEGSFGKVFEAEREDFGRIYKAAIKIVTIPQSQSEVQSIRADGLDEESVTTYFRGFVEEMVGEFALMEQLKGTANVVGYEDHEVLQHENQVGWDIFIRMELLTPLLRRVQHGPLSQSEILRLGIDLCRALELCQKHKIIHRDIKPENIFVSDNGDYKLGDFGIARTVEKTTGGLSKKGTYTYMAPEVYKGEAYGPSADLYSLGLVLYWLTNAHRAPFLPLPPANPGYSDRENALRRRMNSEAIPAPCNADPALAAVILRACAYHSKERYASPAELRQALEALAGTAAPASNAVVSDAAAPEPTEGVFSGGTTERTESIFAGGTTERTESVFSGGNTERTESVFSGDAETEKKPDGTYDSAAVFAGGAPRKERIRDPQPSAAGSAANARKNNGTYNTAAAFAGGAPRKERIRDPQPSTGSSGTASAGSAKQTSGNGRKPSGGARKPSGNPQTTGTAAQTPYETTARVVSNTPVDIPQPVPGGTVVMALSIGLSAASMSMVSLYFLFNGASAQNALFFAIWLGLAMGLASFTFFTQRRSAKIAMLAGLYLGGSMMQDELLVYQSQAAGQMGAVFVLAAAVMWILAVLIRRKNDGLRGFRWFVPVSALPILALLLYMRYRPSDALVVALSLEMLCPPPSCYVVLIVALGVAAVASMALWRRCEGKKRVALFLPLVVLTVLGLVLMVYGQL